MKATIERVSSSTRPDRLARLLADELGVELVGAGLDERANADLWFVEQEALAGNAGHELSCRRAASRAELVVLSAHEDSKERAELLAAGAAAVLNLTLADHLLAPVVRQLLVRRLSQRALVLGQEHGDLDPRHSKSPKMKRALELARRAAGTDATLLLLGPTGAGKEWMARGVHDRSPRRRGPFVAINCAAISKDLIESELFGHEVGAFTGALSTHRGCFEQAQGGTLFLDEIADMSPMLQSRLLRVLEDHRVQRVGAERTIAVDVRVMAATSRPLKEAIQEKTFRLDLYHRLAVLTVDIPALRERSEDLEDLLAELLDRQRARLGASPVRGFAPEAVALMRRYDWPGNIRELRNVVERLLILCTGPEAGVEDLPPEIQTAGLLADSFGTGEKSDPVAADAPAEPRSNALTFPEELFSRGLTDAREQVRATLDREYVVRALRKARGRVGEAAAASSLDRRSFYSLMQRHGIKKETFR